MISPNKPNSRVLLTKQQTRLTKPTTGWRWEESDLEWKLKLSDREKKSNNNKKNDNKAHFDKETCYSESRHILGRMGGNLTTAYSLFLYSLGTHTSNPRTGVAQRERGCHEPLGKALMECLLFAI